MHVLVYVCNKYAKPEPDQVKAYNEEQFVTIICASDQDQSNGRISLNLRDVILMEKTTTATKYERSRLHNV